MDVEQKKQNWWFTPNPKLKKIIVPVIIVIILFSVFKGIFSSGGKTDPSTSDNKLTSPENISSPTSVPTQVPTISMEQKKADFKEFYTKYKKQAQGLIIVQTSIASIAESSKNKADLYLTLEEVEKTQSGIAAVNSDMKVPVSLKEYKNLNSGLFDFQIGGNNYTDAIKYFKEYVNKEDLTKLSKAKEQIERGNNRLTESKTKIDSVAKELGIDVAGIQ